MNKFFYAREKKRERERKKERDIEKNIYIYMYIYIILTFIVWMREIITPADAIRPLHLCNITQGK